MMIYHWSLEVEKHRKQWNLKKKETEETIRHIYSVLNIILYDIIYKYILINLYIYILYKFIFIYIYIYNNLM